MIIDIVKPRKQRERERVQSEIFRAVEVLFLEKGFQQVTMEDIAKKAEFAKGTLYNYFKNKDDLVTSLVVSKLSMFQQQVAGIVGQERSPKAKIIYIIDIFLAAYERDNVLIKGLFTEDTQLVLDKARIAAARQACIQEIATVMEEAKLSGDLKLIDSAELASILMGMIRSICIHSFCLGSQLVTRKRDLISDLFFNGAGS